jgi:hypothetical protein
MNTALTTIAIVTTSSSFEVPSNFVLVAILIGLLYQLKR